MTNFQYSNLVDKLAVVTGAAGGIGTATCLALCEVGATVIAVDRDASGLRVLTENESSILPVCADISDPALPAVLDVKISSSGLNVDILVNNAGVGRGHHALDTSDEEMNHFLEINFMSVFRLSRWAAQSLIARGAPGAIVNVSSVFGLVGAENSAGYSSSKAAIIGLTQQMAADFGPSHIRVNAVAPGLIETPLTHDRIREQPWRSTIMVDQSSVRRLGRPIDVARAIRFLASDEASFITGLTLAVDGGWINGRFPRQHAIDLAE